MPSLLLKWPKVDKRKGKQSEYDPRQVPDEIFVEDPLNFSADVPSNWSFIQKAETTLCKAVLPKLIKKLLGKEAVMEKKPKPQKKIWCIFLHYQFCSLASNMNHLFLQQIPIYYGISKMQISHKSLSLKKNSPSYSNKLWPNFPESSNKLCL